MIKCLITKPNHDKVTSYLSSWSKKISESEYPQQVQFLELDGAKATRLNVESYLKKQNPRVVLFNGHGDYDRICGFKDEVLIKNRENEGLLKGKIVYSLSCSSAKELGKSAVLKGAYVFIGYDEPFVIYTDSEREATPLKDSIASSFMEPSNRVSISILKGNTAREASNKSKKEFEREANKFLTSNAIEGGGRIAAALLWDMYHQNVAGDDDAKITAG